MRSVRQFAAHALLTVFAVAVQLGPVAHLATHRPDHVHGPEAAAPAPFDGAHDAAHAAGLPHSHEVAVGHDEDDAALTPEEAPWLYRDGDVRARHRPLPAGHEHGRDSVSHFGLALCQAPPPPIVPAPGEAIAAAPDVRLRRHTTPALPQPPSRGPPVRRS